MKKTLILLTCFVFLMALSGSASAQPTVAWAVSYDGGDDDSASAVAVDSNDNVIVTGASYFAGNKDYYTIKYDSNGNQLWEVNFGRGSNDDFARGVAVDSNDNVIVTGASGANYYTIKYDSNGNQLWVVSYDGGSYDSANAVAVDSDDNVIVTGGTWLGRNSFYYILGNSFYYTIKYDSNGNQLWARSYGSGSYDSYDSARGVAVDSSNNVIVTGTTGMGFHPSYYTIKYDPNGNQIWAVSYDGGWVDFANAVAVDTNDNVIVTGYSDVGGDFYEDYCTIKYDPSGNLLWEVRYDGGETDIAYGVAVDSNDNVIVTGEDSKHDYGTIKYDSNGNQLWEVSYNGGSYDRASGVAVDTNDNVIVTGMSSYIFYADYSTIKYVEVITATIDIYPDTLKGRWVTAFIELPEGYDVADINVSTILLNDTISAELHPSNIGDYDNDGIPDLMVMFDRVDVTDLIKALNFDLPADVELTVTGSLIDGTKFSGSDTIRVIDKGGC